jgi:hypothetical protein
LEARGMNWKPISKLTEKQFDEMSMHNRLMLWNSCNGPHHLSSVHDGYFAAWQIKNEGVWEKFLILPEATA